MSTKTYQIIITTYLESIKSTVIFDNQILWIIDRKKISILAQLVAYVDSFNYKT